MKSVGFNIEHMRDMRREAIILYSNINIWTYVRVKKNTERKLDFIVNLQWAIDDNLIDLLEGKDALITT